MERFSVFLLCYTVVLIQGRLDSSSRKLKLVRSPSLSLSISSIAAHR